MDFFASQELARKNTRKLVFLLIVTVLTLIAAIYGLVLLLFSGLGKANDAVGEFGIQKFFFSPENGLLVLGISALVICVVAVGSLIKSSELSKGGTAVAESLGGRRLLPNTTNLAERRILNIVEEMSLASGVPVPPVYVLDGEPGINAFAAGHTVDDAVIGINRGTLENLNREELQGVIAHEFSHILNGDMRMSLRMIGLLFGISGIALIGTHLMRVASLMTSRSSRDKGGNPAIVLLLFGVGLLVIGSIGLFFSRLIKASISRQREYLADASAVQFTRQPEGISGALKMIGANSQSSRVASPDAESISHMFFANMFGSQMQSFFATHPPLVPRIQRVEPRFAGEFKDYLRVRSTASVLSPKEEENEHQRRLDFARRFGFGTGMGMGGLGGMIPGVPGNPAGMAGMAGMGSFPAMGDGTAMAVNPALIIANVGSPNNDDMVYSRMLVENAPPTFLEDCREVFSARCIVFASLLHEDNSIRQKQLEIVTTREQPASTDETLKQAKVMSSIPLRFRLPIFEILQGTLVGMSREQFQHFQETLRQLVMADKEIDLFEFFLLHHLIVHLRRHLGFGIKNKIRYESLAKLPDQVELVLSIVAQQGHADPTEATSAFNQAISSLPAMPRPLKFTGGKWEFSALNGAIEELAQVSFQAKKELLTAIAASIIHDQIITHTEAELFRAIAESLDCPVPPIIATETGGVVLSS